MKQEVLIKRLTDIRNRYNPLKCEDEKRFIESCVKGYGAFCGTIDSYLEELKEN